MSAKHVVCRSLDAERLLLNIQAASVGEHYCRVCERRLSLGEFSAADPDVCLLCDDLMTKPATAKQKRAEQKPKATVHRQRRRYSMAERRAAFRPGRLCSHCLHPIGLNNGYFSMRAGALYMRGVCAPCYLKQLTQIARAYREREPEAGAAASRRWWAAHKTEYNDKRIRKAQADANRKRTPERRENYQLAQIGLRRCEGVCRETQALDAEHFKMIRPSNYLYECKNCWRAKKTEYARQKRDEARQQTVRAKVSA